MNKQLTVLITGSRGFTGRYLRTELLSAGYSVWGMTNQSDCQDWEVSADLMNIQTLCKAIAQTAPDYVIHLAGISNVTHGHHEALYQTNCIGTLNLLSAIQQEASEIKNIVLASSAYVYGNTAHDLNHYISESVSPKPNNHYAMSKLSMEYMAQAYYSSLPLVITRPFNYTGIGQPEHHLIPKIIHHFRSRASIIQLGNMHVYREFNDVRMAAKVYSQLLTHAEPGTTVNICTGKTYNLTDILALASDITGHTLQVQINQNLVRANDPPILAGDPTQLNQMIPNLPSYTLRDTLSWMLTKFDFSIATD